MTGLAGRRWQPSDHYDWLSGYLKTRGMTTATRVLMAVHPGLVRGESGGAAGRRGLLVLYNFAVAAIVGLVKAIGLWSSGHAAQAGVDLWLLLQVNIALPLAIQILVRALGVDLLRADHDPLTGLLNRRAFQTETLGLLSGGSARDDYLVVALIDLDSFKALNDLVGIRPAMTRWSTSPAPCAPAPRTPS